MAARDDLVVDCDVHYGLRDHKDLLSYLDPVWHAQWTERQTVLTSMYWSVVGVQRDDARPPSGGPPASVPAYLLEHYVEPYGVDCAILTSGGAIALSLHPDPDYANAVVRAHNDWMIDTWLGSDERFRGSVIVNASDPTSAAEEVSRLAGHPAIVQVVMTSAARIPYGQRFYHPIYAAAEAAGLPVGIHTGSESMGTSGPPTPSGYPTRYMEWHNILPANFMAHVNSLVCEGVFERYPRLTVVMIEGGVAWVPHLMWRMDKNFKALRSTTPWLTKLPSDYIREHIRFTTQPMEEPPNPRHYGMIVEMMGSDELLLYSSDYPHWDFDSPRTSLPPLDRELRRKILGGNAAKVYDLAAEQQATGSTA